MAEFAASLVTLGELGLCLGKVSHRIYRAARDRDNIGSEMQFVADDLGLAADAFQIALKMLRHRTAPGAESEVFRHLKKVGAFAKLNRTARYLKNQMKQVPATIHQLKSRFSLYETYKWTNHLRPKILRCINCIKQVQTSISIILQSASFELNMRHAERTTDHAYRAKLKQDKLVSVTIVSRNFGLTIHFVHSDLLLLELETLEARAKTRSRATFRAGAQYSSNPSVANMSMFDSPSGDLEAAMEDLVTLSCHMRKKGCVPDSAAQVTSPASSNSFTSPGSRSTSQNHSTLVSRSNSRVDHHSLAPPASCVGSSLEGKLVDSERYSSSQAPWSSPSPGGNVNSRKQGPVWQASEHSDAKTDRLSEEAELTSDESSEKGASDVDNHVSEGCAIPNGGQEEDYSCASTPARLASAPADRGSKQQDEEGFFDVRPSGCDPISVDMPSTRESLYVRRPRTLQQAKSTLAAVDPKLPYNLISLRTARYLELELLELGVGNPSVVSFGPGKSYPIIGITDTVELDTTAAISPKCLRLRFLIYECHRQRLILGEPYVKRKKHYWGLRRSDHKERIV